MENAEGLRSRDPRARKKAVAEAGASGDAGAVGDVIALLDDPDDDVRLEAVVALGRIGDQRAVEPLIRKLKGYDYLYIRKKAAYTLYTFLGREGLDEGLRQKIRAHWRSWYLT